MTAPDDTAGASAAFGYDPRVEVAPAREEGLGAAYPMVLLGNRARCRENKRPSTPTSPIRPDASAPSRSAGARPRDRLAVRPGGLSPGLGILRKALSGAANAAWRFAAGGSVRDLTAAFALRGAGSRVSRKAPSRTTTRLSDVALGFLRGGFRVVESRSLSSSAEAAIECRSTPCWIGCDPYRVWRNGLASSRSPRAETGFSGAGRGLGPIAVPKARGALARDRGGPEVRGPCPRLLPRGWISTPGEELRGKAAPLPR